MQRIYLKKLMISTVIVGASSLALAVAANDADGQAQQNTPDRSSVSVAAQDDRASAQSNSSQAVDARGTVRFEPNSVSLTQSAERQLQKVVEQIDKDSPVVLTLEVQSTYIGSDATPGSLDTPLNQDSSSGFPGDERGVAGARLSPTERGGSIISANTTLPTNNAEAIANGREDRAQLISRYRAENIRQYLEREGVDVVAWSMEGGVAAAGAGRTSDTGFATQEGAASIAVQQDDKSIQQVRIVVMGEIRPEGLSAL